MNNKVILGDNLEYMKTIPDKYFELAIVDPPYGIGASNMNLGFSASSKIEKKEWDSEKPSIEYFEELKRISKNQIIWGGNYFADLLNPSRCWLVWDKGGSFKNRSFAEGELAWTSFDNVLRIFNGSSIEKGRIHKCQKPVALYKWLLKNYAKPNDKIFDSHVGSGSIRIACHDMGFDFTGCEIDEDYYKAQEERFKKHTQQGDLFSGAELQECMFDNNP